MNEPNKVMERDKLTVTLAPKLVQVVGSRKVWAGVLGLVTTATLWWLGEIDGTRAIEAMTWVLGIFIGSVALEDGMTHLFSTLAHAVTTYETSVPPHDIGDEYTKWSAEGKVEKSREGNAERA
jgi:hypothetical protein